MSTRVRSSSVGDAPRPKRLFTSRAESTAAAVLDVRCACQFFQSSSILPDRSRPTSSLGYHQQPLNQQDNLFDPSQQPPQQTNIDSDLCGSDFSFGIVNDTDYYAESVISSRPHSPTFNVNPHSIIHDQQQTIQHQSNCKLLLEAASNQLSLDPLISSSQTIKQKDPSKSILLQRRSSQQSLNQPLLSSRSNVASTNIVQRDPSQSKLLQRRTSSVHKQSNENIIQPSKSSKSVLTHSTSFEQRPTIIPSQLSAFSPVSSNFQRDSGYGAAYPDHYDTLDKNESKKVEESDPGQTISVGIGLVDLMTLGTHLVQSREQRYTQSSNEDVRGRSRKPKKQKNQQKKDDDQVISSDTIQNPITDTNKPDFELTNKEIIDNQTTKQNVSEKPAEPSKPPPSNNILVRSSSPINNIAVSSPLSTSEPEIIPVNYHDDSFLHDEKYMENKEQQDLPLQPSPEMDIKKDLPLPSKPVDNLSVSVPTTSIIAGLVNNKIDLSELSSIKPTVMRQRDPSQSSLLRKRYSKDSSFIGLESNNNNNQTPTPVLKQRDLSQSSLIRKRYSESSERSLIKQKDPTTSSLLQRRELNKRSHSQDCSFNPIEKMSKSVSFEYDKGMDTYRTAAITPAALKMSSEMRDKMDWIERTYSSRDHEYEPIADPQIDQTMPDVIASPEPTVTVTAPPETITIDVDKSIEPIDYTDMTTGYPEDEGAVGGTDDVKSDSVMIEDVADKTESHEEEVVDMETQSRLLDQEIAELKLKKIGKPLNEEIESKFVTSPHIDHAKFFEDLEPIKKTAKDQPNSPTDHKKTFMESANDQSKIIQEKLRGHASRLKIKVKNFKPNSKSKSNESPKAKKSKRFKSPDFTKLKNIQIHKPDFKRPEFKRPEFTKFKTPEFKKPDFKINFPNPPKFSKTDISKLKIPERLQSFRFQRSKSLKEPPVSTVTNTTETDDIPPPSTSKKRFEFGTYPRIFDRLRKQSKQPDSSISRDDEGPEEDEISDRVISPVQFATFPKVGKKITRPVITSNESNLSNDEPMQYQRYGSEPDYIEEEASLQGGGSGGNRLPIKDDQIDDYIPNDHDEKGNLSAASSIAKQQTEEQKQLDEYDKENRAIYQISKARESEFKQRKPLVHQESDLVSEDSGRDFGWIENENLRKRIQARSSEMDVSPSRDYLRESNSNVDEDRRERGSTQETQSSGSSSYRRRKGVIEEVDDDEFYLRKKGISQDDIQLGNYISSAIRDGIEGSPNLMARLSQYDHRYYDEDFDDVVTNDPAGFEEYNVPPTKPKRVKDFEKKLANEQPEIPVAAEYYQHIDDENNDRLFYNQEYFDDVDEQFRDNILLSRETRTSPQPIAPLRRKKLLRDTIDKESFTASLQLDNDDDMGRRSVSNSFLPKGNVEDIVVYRTEHEYIIPLEQSDTIVPTPAPRSRSRSRSQSQIKLNNDDNGTVNRPDSFNDGAKYIVEMNEANRYAVVRKEPPPRPPAPARKRNQNRPDKQFATMPHLNKDKSNIVDHQEEIFSTPVRPIRNYSTIGPTRPPRRSSTISLEEVDKPQPQIISDTTEYEEIDGFDKPNSGRDLSSGNTLTKMKHRPLPPPPRPPRERKPKKGDSTDDPDDRYDKDEGRERMIPVTLEDFSQISSMEEVEEVEAATQTDPLSDDFCCEEFEINDDMPVIEPTSFKKKTKTLEEILKEEQQAELDRAKQIADEECLSKGIQKFRDANQRSFSERSRGSTNDRPKTPSSRPITPTAIVIEKKIVVGTTETDARLTVRPVQQQENLPVPRIDSLDDDGSDTKYMDDTADTEDERIVTEALRRYRLLEENTRPPRQMSPVPVSATPQQIQHINQPFDDNLESDTENILEDDVEQEEKQIPSILTLRENDDGDDEEIPIPPPRRRSSTSEAAIVGLEQSIQRVPDPPLELLRGGRLHIQDLEVENLSVGGLQAGRIVVSDLRAISITSPDLENRNPENIVLNGIELPPGFIEDIVDRVLNSERKAAQLQQQQQQQQHQQNISEEIKLIETDGGTVLQVTEEPLASTEEPQQQQQQPPERPPPPPPQSLYPSDSAAYSIPPPSFYQLRNYAEELDPYLQPIHTPSATRRRRHHRRRDDSTSDEEYHHEREQRRNRHGGNRSPEPSITDLSGKLLRACGSAVSRTSTQFLDMIRAKSKENETETGNRHDLNIALIIVIVFVAILMMFGIGNGSRPVHHHHWDYFNPPENNARK